MPQYSNRYTLNGGGSVNTVLNTESNTITYTVSSPTGQTATLTLSSTAALTIGNINDIRRQIINQGGSPLSVEGFGQAVRDTTFNVKEEASKAAATATANNTTVPENPAPPPSVSPSTNPAVPAPQQEVQAQPANTNVDPATDPNTNVGANETVPVPVDQQFIDANQDPQTERDLQFVEAQQNLLIENEAPANPDEPAATFQQNELELYNAEPANPDEPATTFQQNEMELYNAEPQQIDPDEDPGINDATLGELGLNTDLPTEASLGELGINTDEGSSRGLTGARNEARSSATAQDVANFQQKADWRVRLTLAPSATYLYKASDPGILAPLKATDGIIFPYTPSISVNYSAHYDQQELTHSNYKAYQYRSSSIENVSIGCDFTAQDTTEANYMLAVIHFLRSVTKMFYGQDQNPKPGTPPPLCFLFGLGDFQFNAHPLVITSFNYQLPTDVDYIRAGSPTLGAGVNTEGYTTRSNTGSPTQSRLGSSGLQPGAQVAAPNFQTNSNTQPTYVPTKMSISISALPITTRNDISNRFSLKDYATGNLLRGVQNRKAGIW